MTQQQVAPPTTPYGEPISIAAAKKIMASAEAEATRNKWGVSIAIVDSGANLLMLHRLDNGTGTIYAVEAFIYQKRDAWTLEQLLSRGYEWPKVTTWTRATPKDTVAVTITPKNILVGEREVLRLQNGVIPGDKLQGRLVLPLELYWYAVAGEYAAVIGWLAQAYAAGVMRRMPVLRL